MGKGDNRKPNKEKKKPKKDKIAATAAASLGKAPTMAAKKK